MHSYPIANGRPDANVLHNILLENESVMLETFHDNIRMNAWLSKHEVRDGLYSVSFRVSLFFYRLNLPDIQTYAFTFTGRDGDYQTYLEESETQ